MFTGQHEQESASEFSRADATELDETSALEYADQMHGLHQFEQTPVDMGPDHEQHFTQSEITKVIVYGHMSDIDRLVGLKALEATIAAQSTSSREQHRVQEIFSSTNSQLEELVHNRSPHAISALRNLADLCRKEEWRVPAAEAGLLVTATIALTEDNSGMDDNVRSVRLETQTHALRLIGNLCADIDDNRVRALENQTLRAVLDKFEDRHLVSIAVPAAFNICNNFDRARETAIKENLFSRCMMVMRSGVLKSTPSFSSLCFLLDVVCDLVDAKEAPQDALEIMLKSSLEGDLEIGERLSLLRLTNKLLEVESNQQDLINTDRVELVLGSLFRTYSETLDPTEVVLSGVQHTISDDSLEEKELADARNMLVQILSDISARPEFIQKYRIFTDPSMLVWKLKYVMLSPFVPISQAVCLMLGNLAASDDVCIRMVKDINIHEPASAILKTAMDIRLTHAVLGLLRNLALPAENKDSLAMVGVIENLQKCWAIEINLQIPLAAASLVRQMINGSIANIQRLLLMSSPVENESGAMQSQLAVLIRVHDKHDELAIKTEIARTVTAILRCVYGAEIDEETRRLILSELFLNHTTLEIPIIGMISQTQYPVVRSEGWFGLALMSRSELGREFVLKHIDEPEFSTLLQNAVLGTNPAPSDDNKQGTGVFAGQADGSNDTRDRDNALIVVHELLRTNDSHDAVNQQQRDMLERLLTSTSEISK